MGRGLESGGGALSVSSAAAMGRSQRAEAGSLAHMASQSLQGREPRAPGAENHRAPVVGALLMDLLVWKAPSEERLRV